MKKILFFIAVLVTCFSAKAQKQTNNWVFGYSGGITWNTTRSFTATGVASTTSAAPATTTLTGLPTELQAAPAIHTMEGCFTISDVNGNLQFYSDGITIWNKNNQAIATGLLGSKSSTQSGVALPYPGNLSKYIALSWGSFSLPDPSNYTHVYSIIDMAANGGLGAVTNVNTNIPGGSGQLGEAVTAYPTSDGTGYWILAPGEGNNTNQTTYMNAWKVTADGSGNLQISAPVITAIPASQYPTNSLNGWTAYIRISPDGKHFSWSDGNNCLLLFGDFDNSTGICSNFKTITGLAVANSADADIYGVEFSPANKVLYVRTRYKMYAFDAASIVALPANTTVAYTSLPNKTYTNFGTSGIEAALQTGPDGRIYTPIQLGGTGFYVIDNPDNLANLRVYQLNSFLSRSSLELGLPNFIPTLVAPPPGSFTTTASAKPFACTGYNESFTAQLTITGTPAQMPSTLQWNFGDGSAVVTQSIITGTTSYPMSHIYNSAGNYTVTVTPYAGATALTPVTVPTNVKIVDCLLKSNRMIRVDLKDAVQLNTH